MKWITSRELIIKSDEYVRIESSEALRYFWGKYDGMFPGAPGSLPPDRLPWEKFELAGHFNGYQTSIVITNSDSGGPESHVAIIWTDRFSDSPKGLMGALGRLYFSPGSQKYIGSCRVVEDAGCDRPGHIQTLVMMDCQIAFNIIELLLCSNVHTKEIVPDVRLNKARAKKGKHPKASYRTIQIDLGKSKSLSAKACKRGLENLTALHLCRGHFKNYTAEAPLLGKHIGRYWWSPSVRGSKEHGEIHKDYRLINPPEENEDAEDQ